MSDSWWLNGCAAEFIGADGKVIESERPCQVVIDGVTVQRRTVYYPDGEGVLFSLRFGNRHNSLHAHFAVSIGKMEFEFLLPPGGELDTGKSEVLQIRLRGTSTGTVVSVRIRLGTLCEGDRTSRMRDRVQLHGGEWHLVMTLITGVRSKAVE